MELIEILVVLLIGSNFLTFLILLYIFAKIQTLSLVATEFKKLKTAITKILKAKVPVVMGEDGQPMIGGVDMVQQPMPEPPTQNPLTG